jgi:hypothetical protein
MMAPRSRGGINYWIARAGWLQPERLDWVCHRFSHVLQSNHGRAIGGLRPKGDGLASAVGHAQSGVAMDTILRELSELEFVRLLEFIERPPLPQNAARPEDLLRTSVAAAAEGNVQQALGKLAEFARLDPGRAESLETEPGLASIHADVRQLLFRLASAAQLDAETRLGQATMLLQAADSKEIPGQEIRPEILIQLADRLLQAGSYSNCMRSVELSQMVINLYGCATTPALRSGQPSPGLRHSWMPRIKKLWLRAPLLVLLWAWFALGLGAGSVSRLLRTCWPQTWPEALVSGVFEVWAVGFLALILFGFYARVQNFRW